MAGSFSKKAAPSIKLIKKRLEILCNKKKLFFTLYRRWIKLLNYMLLKSKDKATKEQMNKLINGKAIDAIGILVAFFSFLGESYQNASII